MPEEIDACVDAGHSFAFETTLSGDHIITFLGLWDDAISEHFAKFFEVLNLLTVANNGTIYYLYLGLSVVVYLDHYTVPIMTLTANQSGSPPQEPPSRPGGGRAPACVGIRRMGRFYCRTLAKCFHH